MGTGGRRYFVHWATVTRLERNNIREVNKVHVLKPIRTRLTPAGPQSYYRTVRRFARVRCVS